MTWSKVGTDVPPTVDVRALVRATTSATAAAPSRSSTVPEPTCTTVNRDCRDSSVPDALKTS